jgi:hypothetical protein
MNPVAVSGIASSPLLFPNPVWLVLTSAYCTLSEVLIAVAWLLLAIQLWFVLEWAGAVEHMHERDRTKLLFGPYKLPPLKRGDRTFCLFSAMSSSPAGPTPGSPGPLPRPRLAR